MNTWWIGLKKTKKDTLETPVYETGRAEEKHATMKDYIQVIMLSQVTHCHVWTIHLSIFSGLSRTGRQVQEG